MRREPNCCLFAMTREIWVCRKSKSQSPTAASVTAIIHLISNDWGISQYPFIPGHEVIGTVAGVGARCPFADGRPTRRPGLAIEFLRAMRVVHPRHGKPLCVVRSDLRAPARGLCQPGPRQRALCDSDSGRALPSEEAAPLLCGGITVYNPMRTHGVNPSSRVGVVGIGGLGHLAIQFARVFGAEVDGFFFLRSKRRRGPGAGRAATL